MTGRGGNLCFEGVSKCFCTPNRGDVWAVRDFSLNCEQGQLTCIVGPSGCGKTTLLRLAAGLEIPSAGEVQINSAAPGDTPGHIGMISQEGGLLPWRSVIDNVALGLELRSVSKRERTIAAREAIARVHLPAEIQHSFPYELSGGMRQRVALARALCPDPPLLLMDEPFASLDELTRHKLQRQLLEIYQNDRRTIVFVTHSIDEAVLLADKVVVMGFARNPYQHTIDMPHPRDRLSKAFIDHLLVVRELMAGGEIATTATGAQTPPTGTCPV